MTTMGEEDERDGRHIVSDTERQRLEEECQALRIKLECTRKRRRQVKLLLERDISDQVSQWQQRCNEASRRRSEAVAEYRSAVYQQKLSAHRLELAQKWNVTNDCFYIWHRGPFGVINGLRLGSEIAAIPADQDDTAVPATAPAANATITVPWAEINSALGLVVLLLSTLMNKPHSGFRFKNEIVAMGSTSKIGLRRGAAVTYYDLFTDDNFHFFGKRNFNIALTGLVRCVAEAEETVQDRDRTIALPYAIDASPHGEMTIGGLPIAYGPGGEQWTRAMKYLLTDLKWLVAYTTKHVDR